LSHITGLAPALVISDANRRLLDEGEVYFDKLREAGLGREFGRVDDLNQDFRILHSLATTSAARVAMGPATDWLREAWAENRSA
jgi:acetyl esterase